MCVYNSADRLSNHNFMSLLCSVSSVCLCSSADQAVKPHFHVSLCSDSCVCVYSSADLQHGPRTFGCLGVSVENVGQFRVPVPPHRALVGTGLSTVNTSVGVRIFYWPVDSKYFSGVRIIYWPVDSKYFSGGTYVLLACRQ